VELYFTTISLLKTSLNFVLLLLASSLLLILICIVDQTEEPPSKKRRRRSSLSNLGNWEVTVVKEAPCTMNGHGVTSPSNVGSWDVSCVNKAAAAAAAKVEAPAAEEWDKPLENGEYEYFVAPKKSPKRRSLYKAPSNEEHVAENHSPVHDVNTFCFCFIIVSLLIFCVSGKRKR